MLIQAIIARQVTVTPASSRYKTVTPASSRYLKLISLKNKLEVSDNFADSELILDYFPTIEPFDGTERPFTVAVDKPLKIRVVTP